MLRKWFRIWQQVDPVDLCLLMTLILLMTVSPWAWYVVALMRAIAILGVVIPEVRKSLHYWFAITSLLGSAIAVNWYWLDNHLYLMGYWCLAITLAMRLSADDQAKALAFNGRLLLGLCMFLAVAWKAVSPDYLTGDFFEYRLLTDERFAPIATGLGGVDPDILAGNRERVESLAVKPEGTVLALNGVTEVQTLSFLVTLWTIGIEALLAVLFLIPSSRLNVLRDVTLLVFLVTTYASAPVIGFGWLLCIFGIAQSCSSFCRIAFFAAFLLIQLYMMPLASVMTGQ